MVAKNFGFSKMKKLYLDRTLERENSGLSVYGPDIFC
jgi:hypothetical protein